MLLQVSEVTKTFGSGPAAVHVLGGVSLTLAAGETVALTGESGSGKSTLLHLCAGLDRPDSGGISVAGQDIAGLADSGRAGRRR